MFEIVEYVLISITQKNKLKNKLKECYFNFVNFGKQAQNILVIYDTVEAA